MVPEQKQLKS